MMGSMEPGLISILVIEKHPLMREALCAAISDEPDMKVELKAADGMEALQTVQNVTPDMILLALGNSGLDGLETMKSLRQFLPRAPIVALITNEVPGQEQAALKEGACAVLNKAASRLELISKLREIWIREIKNDPMIEKEAPQHTFSSMPPDLNPASRMIDLRIFQERNTSS